MKRWLMALSNGQVVRMVHNNNFSYRVQKPPAR